MPSVEGGGCVDFSALAQILVTKHTAPTFFWIFFQFHGWESPHAALMPRNPLAKPSAAIALDENWVFGANSWMEKSRDSALLALLPCVAE
jgi:hypothetical protein